MYSGLSGLIGICAANTVAWALGYDRIKISQGLYGFNVLLVSLGLGVYFEPGWQLLILLLLSSVLTLFITIMAEGVLAKYGLPYLSIPFLLSIWVLTLASREFSAIGISERGIYTINELYAVGGISLVKIFHWWNDLPLVQSLKIYFISLGAIFFQYNVLSGILISIGLLIYSRIAFSLSLIGFYTAYIFYSIIGANITDLGYSYIGFNFILTAIAVGGFFLIPTRSSYLWTVILIPLVAVFTISMHQVLSVFQLSIYSLPFNIIVLLFIYALKFRSWPRSGLTLVEIQQNSPEKNMYSFRNHSVRFRESVWFNLRLPFWGEWKVSQGHNGRITHKDDWRYAWDFVIAGNDGKTYFGTGTQVEDYHCYNKVVIAPADGLVEEITDGIPDNDINDVNLEDNWGNTIILKHGEQLYTSLNHLRAGSFKVKKGDYVRSGQPLAQTGNSGRSPEPHLHLQVQATPFIGSKTIDYPLGQYVCRNNGSFGMKMYDRPKEGEAVSNIETVSLIKNAFHLVPGMKFRFSISSGAKEHNEEWEVYTSPSGRPYVHCKTTRSTAWFFHDGDLLIFRHFEGDKTSLLFYFFLAAYKVQSGFYEGLVINDRLPANLLFSK
ncbi:MAG: urea transporter, partial [Bacteroidetes bacterium]|nr:urea transporter [Bacteroidota bacterium]